MPGSDRSRHVASIGALFAAITILFGTLAYTFHMGQISGHKDAQAQGYAAAYPNDTSKQIADCWTTADTATAQECVANAIQASHEAQRSEADLSAQRQMSDWAFWALVIATVSTIVTGVGTVLLYQQIVLTREALEDTGNATNAMLDANKIAQNSAEIQLRPYLGITIESANGENDRGFSLIVKNAGIIPAKKIRIDSGRGKSSSNSTGRDGIIVSPEKSEHFKDLVSGDYIQINYSVIRDSRIETDLPRIVFSLARGYFLPLGRA